VSGDYQARFCERLGVKFPRSTLQKMDTSADAKPVEADVASQEVA